jgi:steroid delta-isomerase-like uncharacterized protein
MSEQQNMELMRQIYDVISTGDVDRADELLAEDLIEHEDQPPGSPEGREGFKDFVRRMKAGFPDLKCHIEDMTVDGDKVWARARLAGTHQGEFMGVPATGKRVEFEVIDIGRFENGKGVEHWGVSDAMSLMAQIGAIPTDQQPG